MSSNATLSLCIVEPLKIDGKSLIWKNTLVEQAKNRNISWNINGDHLQCINTSSRHSAQIWNVSHFKCLFLQNASDRFGKPSTIPTYTEEFNNFDFLKNHVKSTNVCTYNNIVVYLVVVSYSISQPSNQWKRALLPDTGVIDTIPAQGSQSLLLTPIPRDFSLLLL